MKIISKASGPTIDPTNHNAEDKKRNALLVVALGLLVIGGFAFWLVKNNPQFFQNNGNGDKNSNIASILFPAWIAIFIPLMAIKKKKMELAKQQPLTPEKIRLIATMLIGTILAVFIFVFFILLMGK